MPSRAAHKTQVYLPTALYRYLKARAVRDGVSMAEVIRRLLEESAAGAGRADDDPFLQLGQPGTRTGISDGATHHDDHVYGRHR